MKPEKQRLINELLEENGDVQREDTLFAGRRILHRRRQLRLISRVAGLAVLLGVGLMWMHTSPDRTAQLEVAEKSAPVSQPALPDSGVPSPAVGLTIESLTDDELLALFPDVPVGLATLADGRKKLIFPRPGDEQRLITNL